MHAVKAFLAELQETSAFATHKKYRLLLTKTIEFSERRGYVMVDQWEPPDVRDFRTSWAINPRTGARRMAMLKPFFEYCGANEFVLRRVAVFRARIVHPLQLDVGEWKTLLGLVDVPAFRNLDRARRVMDGPWTGDDVAEFISLSLYTGLRISDVALFRVDRMNASGEIRVRTTRAGKDVYTWVPQWLQERIRARAKVPPGRAGRLKGKN